MEDLAMIIQASEFAQKLIERCKPEVVESFLLVVGRRTELPLNNTNINSIRVFLVPGMVLAVIKSTAEKKVVMWNGPVLQCDVTHDVNYSEQMPFVLDVSNEYLEKGLIVSIEPTSVEKMPNYVPAVLYHPK